jgi:hypothetical protein
MVYDIGKSTLETICNSIKERVYPLSGSRLHDLGGSMSHLNKEERKGAIEEVVNLCARNNVTLQHEQVSC